MKRFAAILKNLQKHCKVLQISRFGRSEIEGKIILDSDLGPIFMLNWLSRPKFGVKMAILTPFGRLRGTKFALKDALGAPSWTPREPKRAMRDFDKAAVWVMLEPRGPPKGILAS